MTQVYDGLGNKGLYMDFLITGFLLWLCNILNPEQPITNNTNDRQNHYENGAAFFFSSSHLHDGPNQEASPVNDAYDGGPEW